MVQNVSDVADDVFTEWSLSEFQPRRHFRGIHPPWAFSQGASLMVNLGKATDISWTSHYCCLQNWGPADNLSEHHLNVSNKLVLETDPRSFSLLIRRHVMIPLVKLRLFAKFQLIVLWLPVCAGWPALRSCVPTWPSWSWLFPPVPHFHPFPSELFPGCVSDVRACSCTWTFSVKFSFTLCKIFELGETRPETE